MGGSALHNQLGSREIVVTASVVNQQLFDSLSKALKHEGRCVLMILCKCSLFRFSFVQTVRTVMSSAVRLGGRAPAFKSSTATVEIDDADEPVRVFHYTVLHLGLDSPAASQLQQHTERDDDLEALPLSPATSGNATEIAVLRLNLTTPVSCVRVCV